MLQRWWSHLWAQHTPRPAEESEPAEIPLPVRTGPIRPQPAEQLFSPASLQRAWLAVKRAGGGSGVDQVTLQAFAAQADEQLAALGRELVSGRYQPQPLRQIVVPKPGQGMRTLLIWAIRDRIAQRAVYDILAPSYESIFLPCSFGFRPGRKVQDALALAQSYHAQNRCWVLHADIKDCFDHIDGRRLARLVRRRVHDPLLLRYIDGWLRARIFNSADGLPKAAGAGQGGVLSPLFANIYLHEFDQQLVARRLALVRYADDFIICCRRKSEAVTARQQAEQALSRLSLTLNQAKSHIVHVDQGFAWLGHFLIRRECYPL
jgi:group II intron reverse transcriptase/maturase